MSVTIHPTAIVHPKARIGTDVTIGPFCVVEEKAEIGDRCVLDAYVHLMDWVRLGEDTRLHSHATLGGAPQHLGYKGEETWVVVGPRNTIREFVTIHRAMPGETCRTEIGSDCLLMAYVHVAHDCTLGNHVIMANAASLAGHVTVGDHAVISGMTGIHQFVRIGEYAFIGAMGGFVKDVPPYMLATGVRGQLYGPNRIGLKRAGLSVDARRDLITAYKLLFRSGLSLEEGLNQAETEVGSTPEVRKLLDFVRSSKRGITPAASSDEENGAEM